MKKKEIILIGGGGHCKSCIDVIENIDNYNIAGIIDLPIKIGHKILGYEVIASDDDLPKLIKSYCNFLITIGQIKTPKRRIEIYNLLKKYKANMPAIISPYAYISKYADIGEATIVMHHALINAGAQIGSNCIINSKALIEHDVIIENNCHISTNSVINGGTKIGSGTFFGSGSVTKEYTEIAPNSFIKANSIFK